MSVAENGRPRTRSRRSSRGLNAGLKLPARVVVKSVARNNRT